jgi:isocitrate dehydrogenase (NAD+)
MLRALNLPRFGDLIFKGLWNVYEEGKYLTPDVGGTATTSQFTERLIREVKELDKLKSF